MRPVSVPGEFVRWMLTGQRPSKYPLPMSSTIPKKLLILCLGNPTVSDDAVAHVIAAELENRIDDPNITIETAQAGGPALLDLMTGYDSVIVVDGIKTGMHKPGEITYFQPEDYDTTRRGTAGPDMSFFEALKLGRRKDLRVPDEIRIIAIEIEDNMTVREELTPEVAKAVLPAVQTVLNLVSTMIRS